MDSPEESASNATLEGVHFSLGANWTVAAFRERAKAWLVKRTFVSPFPECGDRPINPSATHSPGHKKLRSIRAFHSYKQAALLIHQRIDLADGGGTGEDETRVTGAAGAR